MCVNGREAGRLSRATPSGPGVSGFSAWCQLAGVGLAAGTAFSGAAKYFSSYGDQVAKMAKRTGLSVEALSQLRYVASQTGTEFESLEMGFRRMQRSIYDAGRGLSTAKDALTDLGLRFEDLNGLTPEDQFKKIGWRAAMASTMDAKTSQVGGSCRTGKRPILRLSFESPCVFDVSRSGTERNGHPRNLPAVLRPRSILLQIAGTPAPMSSGGHTVPPLPPCPVR